MLTLPPEFQDTISTFSQTFRKDVWKKAQVLLIGAIVCPGSRTICNLLRSVGLQNDRCFSKYHRFLSKDKWSAQYISKVLLRLLVNAFVKPNSPLVFGIDDTIERRWGPKISKRGIYRDAVRSSKSHFVKCSGLRWLSLMLLTNLPWLNAGVYWSLPILTALCPSENYYTKHAKKHKKLTDWARQMITWLTRHTAALNRSVYLTCDGSFTTYSLFMHAQKMKIGMIGRMKLTARLFKCPPKKRKKGSRGPMPCVGKRLLPMKKRLTDGRIKWKSVIFSEWYGQQQKEMLITTGVAIWHQSKTVWVKVRWVLIKDPEGKLDPVLLACTDCDLTAQKIVSFFVRRWRIEVTFAEVRRHLGVETQRQWSDLAIERSTPSLMALFSIVCLFANKLNKHKAICPKATAWYKKKGVTFSDVLAEVKIEIWKKSKLSRSSLTSDMNSFFASNQYLWFLLTQAVA